jgi:hypothetical protein
MGWEPSFQHLGLWGDIPHPIVVVIIFCFLVFCTFQISFLKKTAGERKGKKKKKRL